MREGERSPGEIMVVITVLVLAMLLGALDQTIVSTALSRLKKLLFLLVNRRPPNA
jgi:hypothetical protein